VAEEVAEHVSSVAPAARREALAREIDAVIAQARRRLARIEEERLEDGIDELLPQEAEWRRHGGNQPWICFVVSRDMETIEVQPWHYPYGNLWNGHSPFRAIRPRHIEALSELSGLDAARPFTAAQSNWNAPSDPLLRRSEEPTRTEVAARALARVLANPDDPGCTLEQDDEARLAFARAVRDVDPPRAAAIRLETPSRGGPHDQDRLLARQLWRLHGARWSTVAHLVDGWEHRRGFVTRIALEARVFLDRAAELYALAPITGVALQGARRVLDELTASPFLARIRVLSLRNDALDDDVVGTLVASPHLGRLVELDLSGNEITMRGLHRLAQAPLSRVEYIDLAGNVDDPTPVEVCDSSGAMLGEIDLPASAQELLASHPGLRWLHPRTPDRGGDVW
jgi:hypothetical protein